TVQSRGQNLIHTQYTHLILLLNTPLKMCLRNLNGKKEQELAEVLHRYEIQMLVKIALEMLLVRM
ncbi:hypothetical protein NXY55_26845, partial [Aeromonas veronii]|nr:hypothetical protein [Aeromonas veronii]